MACYSCKRKGVDEVAHLDACSQTRRADFNRGVVIYALLFWILTCSSCTPTDQIEDRNSE